MELFIPSVLILLLAAAVIFFVLPRFGAPVLALISVALLVFGIYQHMNAFGTEYRLSTWQLGLVSYAPYVMVGGLLVVIAFYLLTVSPWGKPSNGTTAPEIPTVAEMPNAGTATNMVTAGVNNALKGVSNIAGNAAAAVGLGNAVNKAANNKGLLGNAANKAVTGITNTMTGVANAITGNTAAKPANNKGGNKGFRIPGLNFPLSQV
jgi:hypothetical protein